MNAAAKQMELEKQAAELDAANAKANAEIIKAFGSIAK